MKQKINKKPLHFILLDDDLFALTMAEKLIRKYCRRSEIITFSVPQKAIEYMESEDFMDKAMDTVFLTDLHMPEIDGFAVLDRMKNTFKAMGDRLHIFVMSATTCPDEIKRALSYNYVIGFLSKPFSDDKMEQIMEYIQYPL
jgi:two-component system chemotaxis response regulator CheY